MLHAFVYKLKTNVSEINKLRSRYDPYHNLIGPHITLIFPTPESVGIQELRNHVKRVISKQTPFDIHFFGLEKSWDHWLNILVKDGNRELVDLHDELYSGVMASFLRKDLPFMPHVGLGLFTQGEYSVFNPEAFELNDGQYRKALKEAESMNFNFWERVEGFELISLNNEGTKIEDREEFGI